MRLGKLAGRCIVLFLSASLIFGTLGPASVLAESPEGASAADIQPIIDRAEENYRQGVEALAKGDIGLSRRMFDQAVDAVLMSGINLRTNAKLDHYYRDLLDRIHKHNSPNDDQVVSDGVVEPAGSITSDIGG